MSPNHIDTFTAVINFLGIIAFACSGALAAIRQGADIVGVLILSLVACSFGGLTRDIFIGDFPPELMRSNYMLFMAAASGLFVLFFSERLARFHRVIDFFDALGLGLFAVVGAAKGLAYGITPTWSVGLGLITAVGGGMARDILLAQSPSILKSEIYATPAILGAFIYVAGVSFWGGSENVFMTAGALAASCLRLLAIHYHWHVRR